MPNKATPSLQALESGWIQKFADHLRLERRLSPYTVRNYSKAIEKLFLWIRSEQEWQGPLDNLTRRQVRDFLIESQRKVSRRTLHNHVSGIKAFYKYLLKQKIVEKNPFIGVTLPKLQKPLPKFLTEKQTIKLLEGPQRLLENESIPAFRAWRDQLTMELIYGAGLRVSEAVGLNYGMIDFHSGVARVRGKGDKERLCPVGKVAMACLKKFQTEFAAKKAFDDPVLVNNQHKRLSIRSVQLMLKRYLALADLPLDLTPHKIRHSYATHLLNNGADLRLVQELLGHASLSSTEVYTHINLARLKEVYQKAHPRH